jgi:hypothetical protein
VVLGLVVEGMLVDAEDVVVTTVVSDVPGQHQKHKIQRMFMRSFHTTSKIGRVVHRCSNSEFTQRSSKILRRHVLGETVVLGLVVEGMLVDAEDVVVTTVVSDVPGHDENVSVKIFFAWSVAVREVVYEKSVCSTNANA